MFEAVKIDADRLWAMDFLANLEGTGRLLLAPPGIPPARLAYLQAAIKETLHNPQLLAEGEKMERIIEYLDPASTHTHRARGGGRHHARAEGARGETAVRREVAPPILMSRPARRALRAWCHLDSKSPAPRVSIQSATIKR